MTVEGSLIPPALEQDHPFPLDGAAKCPEPRAARLLRDRSAA